MSDSATEDPRIRDLLEFVEGMLSDSDEASPQSSSGDHVARLGEALHKLGLQSQHRERTLRIVNKINYGLLLPEILDQVFDSFYEMLPYTRIGCSVIENEGRTARAVWSRSDTSKIHLKNGYQASLLGSSLQQIIDTGQPRILNDLESYLRAHPESNSTKLIVAEGIRSSLTCPIATKDKVIGFLFFSSSETHAYEGVHADFFLQVAGQLARVIEKSQLHEALYTAKRELEEKNELLERSLAEVRTLHGLIPMCMYCKNIRNDDGFWERVEVDVARNSDAIVSHGLCESCLENHYPE